MHIADSLAVDQGCLVATPLPPTAGGRRSALENWRAVLEFGGGGFEWTVHSAAWAGEWELNRQWPYLYMAEQLNATGIWAAPRSPWPAWGDGGATVRTNMSSSTHWNPPTSLILAPDETVTYGLRLTACAAGIRSRDATLVAAGNKYNTNK